MRLLLGTGGGVAADEVATDECIHRLGDQDGDQDEQVRPACGCGMPSAFRSSWVVAGACGKRQCQLHVEARVRLTRLRTCPSPPP